MCRIVRRMTSGLPSRLAVSQARSAAACPVRRPGPELMNVSDPIPEAPASTLSRSTRPPKEWPTRCTSPRPASSPGAVAAAWAATASMTAAMSKPSSAIV